MLALRLPNEIERRLAALAKRTFNKYRGSSLTNLAFS